MNCCSLPWSMASALRRFQCHLLLVAVGTSLLWQQQQPGSAADAQSCGPRISARFLLDIPCDMTRSAFCNVAGSSYPWHAVRRYIFENQGLVRRMYGDQRHSVIVGSELEARRLRYDDLRFHEPASPHSARSRGRAAYRVRPNSRYANLLKTSPSADGEKVRPPTLTGPAVDLAAATSGPATETTSVSPLTTAAAVLDDDATIYSPGTPMQVVFQGEPVAAPETSSQSSTQAQDFSGTAAPTTTTEQHLLTTTEPAVGEFEPSYAAGEAFTHEQAYATSSQASTTAAEPLISLLDSNSIEAPDRGSAAPLGQASEHPDDDQAPGPQPLKRGVNACPVKQEVLAPYWANNTRGKVLALLNVYPFEQYVHAEKCAFENEQMFCRDGCRCEQQFRLHRLLAFDPRNECRGIFADWFRFPSCCVCICYDLA